MYYFIIGLALFIFINAVVVFAGAVFVLINVISGKSKMFAAETAEGERV